MLPVAFLIESPAVLRIFEVPVRVLGCEFDPGCAKRQTILDALSQ